MNILNINSYFEQPFYENLFSRLKAQSISLDVCVPCREDDKRYDYLLNRYDVLKCYKKNDRFFLIKKAKKIANTILKVKCVKDYDLIHAHSLVSNGAPAYELWKKTGVNYIVAVRSSDLNTFLNFFFVYRPYFKKILLNASRIVFISESGRASFLGLFKHQKRFLKLISHKFIVIPNGIDSVFYAGDCRPKKLPDNPVKILFCGVNNKLKNSLFIARCISKYAMDCTLTIVGKNVDKRIEKKLCRYNFVVRKHEISLKEMPSLYSKYDVFALISLRETFGLCYAEALSQGLPILYTEGTGFDGQFMEGEVGYHVDKRKPIDFFIKFQKIMEKYEQISRSAIKVSEEFSWDIIVKRYIVLYRDILR